MSKHKEIEIIERVTYGEDGIDVLLKGGTGFWVPGKHLVPSAPTLKEGDSVILYLHGFNTVQGLAVREGKYWRSIFYKPDDVIESDHKEWCDNYAIEKQERFDREREKMDADFNALPEPFQQRIQRFRDEDPKFRVDSEAYEMFCCKEAVKIAEYCKIPEAVIKFKDLPWEEQTKVVDDGHSGNTFGGACRLAYGFLKGERL